MSDIFEPEAYSINDLKYWYNRKELDIKPYFQRREVWPDKAKSYLIDTILRGLPIPTIYIRQILDIQTDKSTRQIVDGQQRLTTILSYINNGFKVLKLHNETYGNIYFSDLPGEVKEKFLKYKISVSQVITKDDKIILDMFARINSYSITLNNQEKLNAKYFGEFKQTMYNISREFYSFWKYNNILTENQIARMNDIELVSDLVITMMEGISARNNAIITTHYKDYDNKFEHRDKIINQFKSVIETIKRIYGQMKVENSSPENTELGLNEFEGAPKFYSLFVSIYDILYGLKGSTIKPHGIRASDYPKIKAELDNISAIIQNRDNEYSSFVEAFKRQTTNKDKRELRHKIITKKLLSAIA